MGNLLGEAIEIIDDSLYVDVSFGMRRGDLVEIDGRIDQVTAGDFLLLGCDDGVQIKMLCECKYKTCVRLPCNGCDKVQAMSDELNVLGMVKASYKKYI